jgi:hypothetical protein
MLTVTHGTSLAWDKLLLAWSVDGVTLSGKSKAFTYTLYAVRISRLWSIGCLPSLPPFTLQQADALIRLWPFFNTQVGIRTSSVSVDTHSSRAYVELLYVSIRSLLTMSRWLTLISHRGGQNIYDLWSTISFTELQGVPIHYGYLIYHEASPWKTYWRCSHDITQSTNTIEESEPDASIQYMFSSVSSIDNDDAIR